MIQIVLIILAICALLFLFFTKWRSRKFEAIKKIANYYSFWITDTFADLLSSEPQRVKRIFDRIYWLIKTWAVFWPILGAAWLSWDLDKIKTATSKFFEIVYSESVQLQDYKINWSVTLFDLLTIIWFLLFLFMLYVEDKRTDSKFKRITSAINKAPNVFVFSEARILLDEATSTLQKLLPHESEYERDDFSKIDELIIFLKVAAQLIQKHAKYFFNNDVITGVNIMVFIERNDDVNSLYSRLMKKTKKVYFRCDNENDLVGLLYLPPELIEDDHGHSTSPVLIPIYSNYYQVYKNPNNETDEFILPGAALAFRNGTSMVGNTRDIKKYFGTFDDKTQKELKEFFSSAGDGSHIRSLASFRIPGHNGKPHFSGVLNLHSNFSYVFGKDEEFFDTFYSMIYPVLKLINKRLDFYEKYIDVVIT